MIEKGKGPIINKLHIIQLIEADIQLITRIIINMRNKNRIESDERISKSNYGSRANYLIENVIHEKKLVLDYSLLLGKPITYNMIDLKSCYNR